MAIDTYSDLLDVIKNYADTDKNPDWLAALPGFPALVEAKVRKRLRVGEQSRTADVVTTEGQVEYSPPPRYQSLRMISYRPPPADDGTEQRFRVLRFVAPDVWLSMQENWSGGVEKYTYLDGQFQVLGGPDTGGTLRIVFAEGVEPLSDSVPTNWLLTNYPDVYLSGCMVESLKFQKEDRASPTMQQWQGEFGSELDALVRADKRDRWSGPPRAAAFNRW